MSCEREKERDGERHCRELLSEDRHDEGKRLEETERERESPVSKSTLTMIRPVVMGSVHP